LRVLVAEDNEFNVRHIQRLLTSRGNVVQVGSNGREALALAREDAFDVLLLDLHMPELDGFEVVRTIREREQSTGRRLPVIALTARSRKEDRERCLAAGMDDYLAKPVRAAELFTAVDRLVAGSRDSSGPTSLLSPEVVLGACGGDAEGLRELCQDFQAFAPARLGEVMDALRERDGPRLREAAHKLCGLLSAFSTVAGNLAADLEDRAAAPQFDQARPLVEKLETMVQELTRQVDGVSLERLAGTAAGQPADNLADHRDAPGQIVGLRNGAVRPHFCSASPFPVEREDEPMNWHVQCVEGSGFTRGVRPSGVDASLARG
jgi:two-component system sensor histidine kinase/response regulator